MARWKFLVMLFSMLATEAAAQVSLGELTGFTLGTWDGSLETDLGYSKDRSATEGTATSFDQRNTLYQLNVQNTGFSVIDPSLITGSVGLTLGMGKDTAHAEDITSTVSTGLLGYSFDAEFLNDLPYGGALFATHSHTTTMQPFGHQENNTSNRGMTMRLNEGSPFKDMGFPYLSANLRLEQQDLDQLSTSALNQNYRFSEHRKSLVQDGHKGAESSDLNWRYEANDIKQPLNQNGNNQSQNASLDYSADFGELLNRRWDSRINFSDRTGVTPLFDLTTLSIGETLQIAHQKNLSTSYDYQLLRVVSQGVPSVNQTGTFTAQYQPYQNLSTSASFQHQQLPTGKLDSGSGGMGYQYLHDLPWEGKLHFTASGGYGQTKTTSIATTGHIDYEGHPVKFDPLAVNQEITFGQGFVSMSSPILVYAINSKLNVIEATLVACQGSTMPTDGTCDYIIEAPLGNKTIIRLNPLSTTLSGLGNNIDALAVSYSYNAPPSLTYATITSSTGLTIDYRWVMFTFMHAQSDVHQRSGSDSPFLKSTRQDRAQVDLKGSWQEIQGAAGAAYQTSDDTLVVYRQEHYYSSATYPYSYELLFGFNADKLMSQYQNPERSSETDSIRLTATWFPMNDMTVNAVVGQRSMRDSKQPTETVDEASVKAQMKYGKIRLTSSLTANKRVRGSSELSNWRFDLTLVRNL